MPGQVIKCNVNTCKYNDKKAYCSLNDITVGNTKSSACRKEETECVSFENE